jgi:hypothetical protein
VSWKQAFPGVKQVNGRECKKCTGISRNCTGTILVTALYCLLFSLHPYGLLVNTILVIVLYCSVKMERF